MLLTGACCLTPLHASPSNTLRPQDATQGSLWLRDDSGAAYQPVPTLKTDVDMDITGLLARVHVRQTFNNPGDTWAEGIYVFPLPENAAVDHLRMHVGERIIEGQLREREEARKTYEQAKQAGQRTSLVEQERPNIFTTSLANIAPGESISIEIEYQQTVRYDNGDFRIRFPMVTGPRYIPGTATLVQEQVTGFAGSGWARGTTQVADAARITPPVQHPDQGTINPVSLNIHLKPGIPVGLISSSYHRITKQKDDNGGYRITLTRAEVPADRDFELVWQPQADTQPTAAWFVESREQQEYGLLMVVPPTVQSSVPAISRDITLVIDTSGSMYGASMQQAREALLLALDRLTPQDRFNIIAFNDTTASLFRHTEPATVGTLALARNFVKSLQANGGTEMLPALTQSLQSNDERNAIRQIIFLTDGSVGNEQQLFDVIRKGLGNSRLFTIGIGSAPNSHFMSKAAEYGRGSFTYIGKTSEVKQKLSALFRRIEQPALTDIEIELPQGLQLDTLPARIPDVYAGEPLLLAFSGPQMPKQLLIRGTGGDQPWETRLTLDGGRQGSTLAPEWGRRKIANLISQLHDASSDDIRGRLRAQIVATALRHHLVSKYTSLVAAGTPARGTAPATRHEDQPAAGLVL